VNFPARRNTCGIRPSVCFKTASLFKEYIVINFAGSISQWKFITLKAQYTTVEYSSQHF
jgi:hypothetical protein